MEKRVKKVQKQLFVLGSLCIKKRIQHKYFPVNIAKLLRTGLFIKHHQWLLFKADESWQDGTGVTYALKLIIVNCDQFILFDEPPKYPSNC